MTARKKGKKPLKKPVPAHNALTIPGDWQKGASKGLKKSPPPAQRIGRKRP